MNPHLTPMQPPQDQGCPLLASRKSSSIMVVGKFRKRSKIIIKNPGCGTNFSLNWGITIRDVTLSAILSPGFVTDVMISNLRPKCRFVFVQKVTEMARFKNDMWMDANGKK